MQVVPDTTPAAVLVQMTALNQRSEVLLERVTTGAGQFDGLANGNTTMLATSDRAQVCPRRARRP